MISCDEYHILDPFLAFVLYLAVTTRISSLVYKCQFEMTADFMQMSRNSNIQLRGFYLRQRSMVVFDWYFCQATNDSSTLPQVGLVMRSNSRSAKTPCSMCIFSRSFQMLRMSWLVTEWKTKEQLKRIWYVTPLDSRVIYTETNEVCLLLR